MLHPETPTVPIPEGLGSLGEGGRSRAAKTSREARRPHEALAAMETALYQGRLNAQWGRGSASSLPPNRFPQSQWTSHPHAHDSFRNFELSLQSPLHPSIALLVRYRSHTGIQPYQGYTWQFRLQSQGALLVHQAGVVTHATGQPTVAELQHGAVTLDSKSIPDRFTDAWPRDAVL